MTTRVIEQEHVERIRSCAGQLFKKALDVRLIYHKLYVPFRRVTRRRTSVWDGTRRRPEPKVDVIFDPARQVSDVMMSSYAHSVQLAFYPDARR